MPLVATSERLVGGLMSVVRPVGEFIHVSAIYMGIAVLTTLGLSLVLPSMRQQSQQLHEVVLTMFQTDGGGYAGADEPLADLGSVDWSMPIGPVPPPADAQAPGAAAPSGGEGAAPSQENQVAGASASAEMPNFSHALEAAIRGQEIPGVSQAQAQALRSYIARKYKIANSVAGALVRIAFAIGAQKNLDPQLLLAVIAIESRYNPFAESAVGAQGLMQVMTRVHHDKLEGSGGGQAAVFNPVVNIDVGAQILADCVRRRGSVTAGLACYVGATGPSDGGYGARVLAEQRRIALASGIAPNRR
ncbi:lytic transglycosylase domain-containing protein [Castellaniella sp. GW247-6E4]|uniref:lytic transglycosylase domain-containing protein n=1 Tax=Castellaniella sp. GW247-6E4 TaxID=3140380 RepID=UPI0033162E24